MNYVYKLTNIFIPLSAVFMIVLFDIFGNFLAFHSFLELFTVFVSINIMIIAYYSFRLTQNKYLLFLGLGYFWVGILDLFHVLTYPGVNIFEIDGANTTLTLWVFTRLLEAMSIFLALIMFKKTFYVGKTMIIFGVYSFFAILLAFYAPLPLFDSENGLSSLKIGFEYVIVAVLVLSFILNHRYKSDFNKQILNAIQLSIILTILSELSFTLYSDIDGMLNLIGHIFEFLSFWVLFVSIVKVSLDEPLEFLIKKESHYNNIAWLKKLLSNSHIGILVVDKNRKNLFVNEHLCKMYGYEERELLENSAEILHINHETYTAFAELAFDFVLKGKTVDVDYQFKRKDGTLFWGHISGDLIENASEILWTIIDISKRKAAEEKIVKLQKRQELAFLGSQDGLWDWNLEDNSVYFSPRYKEMIGYEDSELKNEFSTWENRVHKDDLAIVMKGIEENIERKTDYYEGVHRLKHKDGHWVWILARAKASYDENGKAIRMTGTHTDITEKKELEQELQEQKVTLEHQAHHDALTGLPNRVLFHDRLNQAIEKAKRKNSLLALLFIDLDHFKEINDSLGHDVGDEVLKEATIRLKSSLRDEDTLARLGGDEFTVILEDISELQDASRISKKILENLAQVMDINNNALYVSSSIGISVYPDDGASSQNLLKFADSAMYKAKDEGRNNFQYYNSSLTELAFERVVMEASLREALVNEEFVVYYQAQVNGATDRLIGMEALVRWKHPTMGLVPPYKFIPLAESTGLIVQLDRFVMQTAMRQLSQWYKQGLKPGVLAMNLAIKQFQQEDFIPMFEKLIQETECKTEWLELEVTEGQIMTHPEDAIVILKKISDLGIELAVDDFGTGYSSLAYLKRLPIDKLKIDQAFIRNLPDDEEDAAIAKAVIALAKSLNLRIIAEGVETKEQKDFIVENGCENIQGYFYSKPVCADEFETILKSGFKSHN